jgi:hypothetical protein
MDSSPTTGYQCTFFIIKSAFIGMTLFIISPFSVSSNQKFPISNFCGLGLTDNFLEKNFEVSFQKKTKNISFFDRKKILIIVLCFVGLTMFFFIIPNSFAQGITLAESKRREFEARLYPENITFFSNSLRKEVIKRKLNSIDAGSIYQFMPAKFFSDENIIEWAKELNGQTKLNKGLYVDSLSGNLEKGFTFSTISITKISPITQISLAMCTLKILYFVFHQKPLYFRY